MTRRKILNRMKRKTRKTKKKTLKKMKKEIQIMEQKMILKTKMTMTPKIDIEAVFLEIRLINGRKYKLLSQKLHRGQRSESQYRINSKD